MCFLYHVTVSCTAQGRPLICFSLRSTFGELRTIRVASFWMLFDFRVWAPSWTGWALASISCESFESRWLNEGPRDWFMALPENTPQVHFPWILLGNQCKKTKIILLGIEHTLHQINQWLLLVLSHWVVRINSQKTWRVTSQTSSSPSFFTLHLYFPASFTLTLLIFKQDQRPGTDSDSTVKFRWPLLKLPCLLHVTVLAGAPWTTEQFRDTSSLRFTDSSRPSKLCLCSLHMRALPSRPGDVVREWRKMTNCKYFHSER